MKSLANPAVIARRHLVVGWGALVFFVGLGIVLEALLAFKAGAYVDVGSDTRREMWRLAHAHGIGIALVHIAYGLTVKSVPGAADALASSCLLVGLLLVPLGFFGGGFATHGGDPGALIFAVPPGAVALVAGVLCAARAVVREA